MLLQELLHFMESKSNEYLFTLTINDEDVYVAGYFNWWTPNRNLAKVDFATGLVDFYLWDCCN